MAGEAEERETGEGERDDPDPAGYGSDFKGPRASTSF